MEASYQVNTTHSHTAGGFHTFCLGNIRQGGFHKQANPGYYIPRPPPRCFQNLNTAPRQYSELVVKKQGLSAYRNLSQSVRSPVTDFVGTTSIKPMIKSVQEVPGPGAFDLTRQEEEKHRKGLKARSFSRGKRLTGEHWSSSSTAVGPGSYGIPEHPNLPHSPSPHFRSKLSSGRPPQDDSLGPGSFKISPRAESMTRRSYSSVGHFASSPRFSSRAERLRILQTAKSHYMLTDKDYLFENICAAAGMTAASRADLYIENGKKRDERISIVKKRRLKILLDEDKRMQRILARPEKLRRKRRQRSFLSLIVHGPRLTKMTQQLIIHRKVRERLQHRAAVQMYIGKWWRKWQRQVMTHRITRFKSIWRCSTVFVALTHRIRVRKMQADIIHRHLRSIIGPRKALSCVRRFASNAVKIQNLIRCQQATKEARAKVLLQQMLKEWRATIVTRPRYVNEGEPKEGHAPKTSKKHRGTKAKKHKGGKATSKKHFSSKSENKVSTSVSDEKLKMQEESIMREVLLYLARSKIKSWAEEYQKDFKRYARKKKEAFAAANESVSENSEPSMKDAGEEPVPKLRRGLLREDETAILLFEAEELKKQRLRSIF